MEDTVSQEPSKSSSSKTIIILASIVVVLILGGAGYMVMGKNTAKPMETSATPQPSPTSSSAFSSIHDAMTKSLSLKCDFSDEKTNQKTIAYIKGGAIRSDIMGKTKEENSSINRFNILI